MTLSHIQGNVSLQKSGDSPQGPTGMQLSQDPEPGVKDSPTHAVCTTVPAAWGVMASRGSLFLFGRREAMFILLAQMMRSLSSSEKRVIKSLIAHGIEHGMELFCIQK